MTDSNRVLDTQHTWTNNHSIETQGDVCENTFWSIWNSCAVFDLFLHFHFISIGHPFAAVFECVGVRFQVHTRHTQRLLNTCEAIEKTSRKNAALSQILPHRWLCEPVTGSYARRCAHQFGIPKTQMNTHLKRHTHALNIHMVKSVHTNETRTTEPTIYEHFRLYSTAKTTTITWANPELY